MRGNVVLLALFVLTFAGCEEPDKIYVVSPPAEDTPTDVPPPEPSPVSFQADARTGSNAVAVEAWPASVGNGPIPGEVWLNPVALWPDLFNNTHDQLTSMDVLLRVDPRSNPQLVESVGGSWCFGSGQPQVTPTGNPGEWRIQRSPGIDDCTCGDQPPEWAGPYSLAGIHLKLHKPGTWRVDVVPASGTPACDCLRGCLTGISFFGGTLTVPKPS